MRILRSITIKKASSRRSLMSLCYKTISSCCSCAYVEILSTWEVWRALKRLELHSAAPRATLTPLSCSPNFPRAQYLDIRTLMHELIVNLSIKVMGQISDFKSFPVASPRKAGEGICHILIKRDAGRDTQRRMKIIEILCSFANHFEHCKQTKITVIKMEIRLLFNH